MSPLLERAPAVTAYSSWSLAVGSGDKKRSCMRGGQQTEAGGSPEGQGGAGEGGAGEGGTGEGGAGAGTTGEGGFGTPGFSRENGKTGKT